MHDSCQENIKKGDILFIDIVNSSTFPSPARITNASYSLHFVHYFYGSITGRSQPTLRHVWSRSRFALVHFDVSEIPVPFSVTHLLQHREEALGMHVALGLHSPITHSRCTHLSKGITPNMDIFTLRIFIILSCADCTHHCIWHSCNYSMNKIPIKCSTWKTKVLCWAGWLMSHINGCSLYL